MVIEVLTVAKCTGQDLDKKRRMEIHEKEDILQVDTINPEQNSNQVYHICLKSFMSADGFKSRLSAHERELINNQDV